jgi:hypothetical protein
MSTIEELRVQNEALEKSSEYQRIILEVMREVYIQFVNERIEQEEKWLEMDDTDTPFYDGSDESMKVSISKRIAKAKRLLSEDPAKAAQFLSQLGSCHTLWALQKHILKEKYGITWYTPDELHPEIIFD